MSADAVDFRLHVLHGELVFGHQVDFVLQTENEVRGHEVTRSRGHNPTESFKLTVLS